MLSLTPKLLPGYSIGATCIVSIGLLLAGCDARSPEPAVANAQTEAPAAPEIPSERRVSAPQPALTRGDLVSAAGQEASAFAEGKTATTTDPLVGRAFATRIPFGCAGPESASAGGRENDGFARWSWGPERQSIELSLTPADWSAATMFTGAGATTLWEAVEGFWVPRPWLASEACPTVRTTPLPQAEPEPSPQTLGLAAVFERGGSRIGRRNGRPYRYTIRAQGNTPLSPPRDGYRLVVEGRVASFPSGRAISCRADGPNQRPVCIAAIHIDRVAFESDDGSTLSEWHPG